MKIIWALNTLLSNERTFLPSSLSGRNAMRWVPSKRWPGFGCDSWYANEKKNAIQNWRLFKRLKRIGEKWKPLYLINSWNIFFISCKNVNSIKVKYKIIRKLKNMVWTNRSCGIYSAKFACITPYKDATPYGSNMDIFLRTNVLYQRVKQCCLNVVSTSKSKIDDWKALIWDQPSLH